MNHPAPVGPPSTGSRRSAPGVAFVSALLVAAAAAPLEAQDSVIVRDSVAARDSAVVLDVLTVVAQRERPLLNTEDAATGGALEARELRALPTDAREPLSLFVFVPGIARSTGFFGDAPPLSLNGANSLYTQYLLDGLDNNEGFLGGPRVEFPLGGLLRQEALVNSYTSAFGRSATGIISQESRAGGDALDGSVFAYYRPGRPFDALNKIPFGGDPAAIARQQDGFRRVQFGGDLRGPLRRGRTFFSLAGEYSNEREDRIGSTALTSFVGTETREKIKLFGRLDHGWSPTQTTTLRAAYSWVNRAGNGSGVVTPEADLTTRRIGSLTALTHRSTLAGGRAGNTASVQLGTFRWYFPPTRSDFSRPQVTVVRETPAGLVTEAVVGSSNFVFDETELQLQLRDVFEVQLGDRHLLRVGADVVTAWFELTGAQTNLNGAYVVYNDGNIAPTGRFLSITDIPPDVRVRGYTIDANPQQVDLTQTVVGAFVEGRWQASPRLVVQAGVRWDYDDITSRGESSADLNNFQPRVSFNWHATPQSVVRGGVGAYAGKLPYTIFSDAVQFGPNGNATVTFEEGSAFPPPIFGAGPRAEDLAALRDQLPPREQRRAFAFGLRQPMSYQATLGYQRSFGANWAIAIDGVWVETRNLPRSLDLNPILRPLGPSDMVDQPPSFGDQFRPVTPAPGSFRRLTTTESGGRARYLGLYTAVRRRLSDAWTLEANWVWSHAQNDTEDINFNASQGNCFGKEMRDAVTGLPCTSTEWADATNDRRHQITLRSVYTWSARLQLGVLADFQTGQPVNRVAGVLGPDGALGIFDLDGSGPIFGNGFIGNHDRFFGVPRNGERLPSFFDLSASITYLLPIGADDLALRADVFNILNRTEWGNFANGIPGGGSRTQVGRPGDPIVLRSPGPPRQVQFSVSYAF